MNEEDDHKRIEYIINVAASMPQDLRLAISQARNAKNLTQ
jgi:hypothetical protein